MLTIKGKIMKNRNRTILIMVLGVVVVTGLVLGITAATLSARLSQPFASEGVSLGGSSAVPAQGGTYRAVDGPRQVRVGDTVEFDGVLVTTTPLFTQSQRFGGPLQCSVVTYINYSDNIVSFNMGFDWKLQDSNGVIKSAGFMGDDLLSAGELASGGTVAGNVCFDEVDNTDTYTLILDDMFDNFNAQWVS
jgi:hypothetical protein